MAEKCPWKRLGREEGRRGGRRVLTQGRMEMPNEHQHLQKRQKHSTAPGAWSEGLVGVPACFQTAVSIHISLSSIPQIHSLLQQPSQVRTQGRTTRTRCRWLRKQQVTNSRARSSIPFGGLPKCLDPPWARKEGVHPLFAAG